MAVCNLSLGLIVLFFMRALIRDRLVFRPPVPGIDCEQCSTLADDIHVDEHRSGHHGTSLVEALAEAFKIELVQQPVMTR
jgi:hypothetical protein